MVLLFYSAGTKVFVSLSPGGRFAGPPGLLVRLLRVQPQR